MTKQEKQTRLVARLQKLANKASDARDKWMNALEKAKTRSDWEQICSENGINPDADWHDWMA